MYYTSRSEACIMNVILRVLSLIVCIGLVESSHFRGGIVQWSPTNANNFNGQIDVRHRIAWRRSSGGTHCDSTTISSRTLIGGGNLQCDIGCSGTVGSLEYYCTDYSSAEDWSSGERTFTYNMGSTITFEATFTGCCWISTLQIGRDSNWEVRVKGTLTPRSDNGLINSSPVSATTPIVRIQFGCTRVINIPVQDADTGDDIRCRWATGNECSGICQSFPYVTLSGCSLQYNGGGNVGLYAVALQIEDFISTSSNTALSSVPLQFLVEVFSSTQSCFGTRPTLVGETIPDEACIAVPFGTTFQTSVVAMVGHTSISIVNFPTVSPLGVLKSAVSQSSYNSLLYYTNITWTPQTSQYGLNILCYSARDSNSLTSNQFCITLLGGVQGPMALQNTTSPTGAVVPGQSSTFFVEFDQVIGRPGRNSYIRIFENNGVQVVTIDVTTSSVTYPVSGSGGRLLTFTTSYGFQSGNDYYILLDLGVAVGVEFCSQESISVQDSNFWRFSTGVNECAQGLDNCSPFATCVDTDSSFYCICLNGYSGDGANCNDINECLVANSCPLYSNCTNTLGSFTCTCTFGSTNGVSCTVPPSPDPPTSVQTSNIGTTSCTVSWILPASQASNGIDYFIIILTELKFGLPSFNVTVLNSITTYEFTGLEEFDSYRCDVLSVSVYGFQSTVVSINFTTLATEADAAPISLTGIAISPTLITLSWANPPAITINGAILFYFVEVTEVLTGRTFTFHAVDIHITIGPLHAYYEYICRVAIFTTALGPFSGYFSVYSGETVPTAPPENVRIGSTTPSSLLLSWDPPPADQQNGQIRYYVIHATELGGSGNSLPALQSNTTQLLITNLLPIYNPYVFSLAAYTVGLGPISLTLTVNLPEASPSAPPGSLNGFAVDHTSMFFEWQPPPLHQQNGNIVQYVINITERDTGIKFQRFTTQTSISITMLHPDYIYDCQVSAVTVAEGPFSAVFSIRINVAAPSSPPENVVSVSPDPYSVLLTWNPPPSEDRNGPIIGYIINVTVLQTGEKFQLSSNVPTLLVESLRPFTTYVCVFAALTPVGIGPFSNTYIITTPEDVPSNPVSPGVTTFVGNPTSLFISWSEPTTLNGFISHYTVYCEEEDTTGSGSGGFVSPSTVSMNQYMTNDTVPGNSTFAVLSGLVPYTTYNCFVSASTSAGESSFSPMVTATTDESVPGDAPMDVTGRDPSSSSVFLTWREPEFPNGIIVSYNISYNLTGGATTISVYSISFTGYQISNLDAFTYYEFVISASTRVGSGPTTSIVIRTDEASPDSPPLSISTSVGSSTASRLSWSPPPEEDRNGLILFYTLILTDLQFNTSNILVNTTNVSYSFTGLQEYARYSCRIAAGTRAGIGPFSPSVYFVTHEDVPSGAPQLVNGVVRSSTLVTFAWSPPPLLEVNGVIQYYRVIITERHTGRTWTFFAVDDDIHIGSLHPYYYYDCTVSAYTIGAGPFSQTVSVQTNQAAPIAAPEQPSVLVTSDTLILMWNSPPFEDTNGIIRYYMATITELDTGRMFTLRPNATVTTFSNLHPYYIYECTVAAYTVGLGPYSNIITVQLAEEAPTGEPVNIMGSSVSSESILIAWDAPPTDSQNGMIRNYTVNVTEIETGMETVHFSLTTEITLFSLHPFYTYEITIAAVTVAQGPLSSPITVQTDSDVPSAPVQNPVVSLVTSESASLTWEPPNEEDHNGMLIGYSINVTVGSTGASFTLTSVANSISITSLKPFTVYTCQIAALTLVGAGPYSIAFSVMTLQSAPISSPEDLQLSPISSTSIFVSWSPPPLEDQNGIIRMYRINITEFETGREIVLSSTSTSLTVQFLHPFYTYECVVSAVTVEEGPYTETVVVMTPEDAPGGYPQNFNAVSSTSRSADITWEPPSEEDRNGIIINYTINVTAASTGQTFQLRSTTTSITVTSLKPYTTYFCIIAASTSVGVGPPSTVFTLNTPEDVPTAPPLYLSVIAQDSNTAMLTWSPPETDKQNGVIREYRIRVTVLETGNTSYHISTITNIEVSSLHPDYTYFWSVAAFTVGIGPYSELANVTTPEDVPSGPAQNFRAVTVTSTSLHLVWALPSSEDRNGEIIGYVIDVRALETDVTIQLVSMEESLNITELTPFTTYTLVIAAQTIIGTGPSSEIVTVRTLEDAPTSHPTNSSGMALNSTHIYLYWDPPPENSTNGIIREYRINVTEVRTGALLRFTTDPNTRELTLGPLHPFYTYHCTIVAHTVEPGPFTEVITIQTDEAAPSGPPASLEVSVEDSRSIMLTWSPPLAEEQNGILRQYQVALVSATGINTHTVSASSSSLTITGLRPYTVYTCSVRAQTVALGPQSILVLATTPEDIPTGPPQVVSSVAIEPTVLIIQWESPRAEHTNGVIRRYTVNVTEIESGSQEVLYSESTNVTVTSRHPFYRYSYTVSAETVGSGPFSSVDIVQMPEAAPSASPDSIVVSNTTANSFLLSWNSPPRSSQNGVIRNYTIILTEEDTGREIETATQRTSELFETLHPFYNYTFQVAAVTVAVGPFSQIRRITTLEDVPASSPQNFSVTTASSTSLKLNWEPPSPEDRNGLILGYMVRVVSQGSDGTATVITTSSTTYYLMNLTPYIVYSCSVVAFTAVGNGPTTLELMATTAEDAPSGPPTSLTVTSVTSTALTLNWIPPDVDLQNGQIRHYLITVYERDTGGNFTLQTLANTQFTVGDLHPYYTYEFTVQAVTVAPGPVSTLVSILTPQDVPTSAPQSIEAFALDSRTLNIQWNAPPPEFHNGIILDYYVNVSTIETGEVFQVAAGGSSSVTIPGLHPFYTYVYITAAATSVGRGPFSVANSIQMPEDVPSSYPLGFVGESVNSTSILLQWQHPETQEHNGIIISYAIMLTEVLTGRRLEYDLVGSHLDILIGSLHPYYRYECVVSAGTSVGRGPFTPPITLQTLEDAPSGPPLSVNATAISSTAVHVSWDPPSAEQQNGIIRQYFINVFNTVTQEYLSLDTTATFITVSNLHPFYAYRFTVAGFTNSVGQYSDGSVVTLLEDVPTGVPVNVDAVSVSSTSIRISWEPPQAALQNGLITSYHITATEIETGTIQLFTTEVTDNLYIVNSLHPFYNYNCSVAAFTVGLGPSTYISVQTLPEEPSEVPQDIIVSALSPTSVMISWNPPPPEHQNGIIVGYVIRVTGVDAAENIELSVNNRNITVPSLHPFYTYRFSVAAVTIAFGPFNNPVTLKMPEAAPSAPVENTILVAATATSATIAWYPPDPDLWNGIVNRYFIDYELLGPIGGSSNSAQSPVLTFMIPSFGQPLINNEDPTRVNLPLQMETALINGLEEYHVYRFSVYFETGAGRSSSSNFITVETSSIVPSGPPTSVVVTVVSTSSLRFDWLPPEVNDRNGIIVGYHIILNNRQSQVETSYNVSGGSFSLQVEGLESFTEYQVSIAALTELGMGPYSPPVLVKTLENVPGVPSNVIVKAENGTAVTLAWLKPLKSNGDILEYQIYYYGFKPDVLTVKRAAEITILDGPYVLTVNESQESVVVVGLKSGLFYRFLVRARTSVGYGPNSTAVQVELEPTEVIPLSGPNSTSTALIVIAVLGWIVLLMVIVIVMAIYIYRKKHFTGKYLPSGQRDDESSANVYELNGTGVISENQYATTADLDEQVHQSEFTSSIEKPKLDLGSDEDKTVSFL